MFYFESNTNKTAISAGRACKKNIFFEFLKVIVHVLTKYKQRVVDAVFLLTNMVIAYVLKHPSAVHINRSTLIGDDSLQEKKTCP